MRIEVLEYFLEIVRCQSFSQASTSLFISQQGLGKAMRALESELGIVIFRKNGRVLELTEEGAVLEEHAKRIVKQSEDLREALFKIQIETAETQEPLQVYATSYVCNAIYNLLESELIEYDLNNCSINELELNEILNAIDCGNTSFGLINILASDIAQLDDIGDIEFTPLLAMNITVKVPDSITSDYPAGSITVEQLSQLPLHITMSPF